MPQGIPLRDAGARSSKPADIRLAGPQMRVFPCGSTSAARFSLSRGILSLVQAAGAVTDSCGLKGGDRSAENSGTARSLRRRALGVAMGRRTSKRPTPGGGLDAVGSRRAGARTGAGVSASREYERRRATDREISRRNLPRSTRLLS